MCNVAKAKCNEAVEQWGCYAVNDIPVGDFAQLVESVIGLDPHDQLKLRQQPAEYVVVEAFEYDLRVSEQPQRQPK